MLEDEPIGYVKAYNPILVVTTLIAVSLTLFTTLLAVWWYADEAIGDRMLTLILIVVSFAELNVTVGLWYLTYKYARISEEPLQKLKRLAHTAEQALDWWEVLTFVFAPLFNMLKEVREKMTWKPTQPPQNSEQARSTAPAQPGVHPEVVKYFEGYNRALRSIDARLKKMELREEDEELRWGTGHLK